MPQQIVASASEATELNKAIEAEAIAAASGEISLNRTYSRLAGLLAHFKATEGWRALAFPSFNRYLISLVEKTGRSVQQLYTYTAVAEALLPAVGAAGLEAIGVTKAIELVRASKKAGRAITPELIAAALDPKNGVNEIRALAHIAFELKGVAPKGSWFDLGGFYATTEFKKLFQEAFEVTVRILELPKEMPHWQKLQRVIEAWAQEFKGTYEQEVSGAQSG